MTGRSASVRRSPWLRAVALLSALALLFTGATDAYGLHRCEHHDALPGVDATATAAAAHAGHGAHEAHAAIADRTERDRHGDAGHDDGCTCVGDCAGAPGFVTPDADASSQLNGVRLSASPMAPRADAPRADRIAHVLPFAQAPPATR